MAYGLLRITLPNNEEVCCGKQVTFIATEDSENVAGLWINNEEYSLVDAAGKGFCCTKGVWSKDSLVSIILDPSTHKAYIQGNTSVITQTGHYAGTGECGDEHPTTFEFDFVPKSFMLGRSAKFGEFLEIHIIPHGSGFGIIGRDYRELPNVKVSLTNFGKTIKIVATTPENQFNIAGYSYFYKVVY